MEKSGKKRKKVEKSGKGNEKVWLTTITRYVILTVTISLYRFTTW